MDFVSPMDDKLARLKKSLIKKEYNLTKKTKKKHWQYVSN
jgi:hypothetical protein